jgi:hypothetical protein
MSERSVSRAAASLGRFVRAHGGRGDAAVEHLGGGRVRVVVVADDGAWGDRVLRRDEDARAACERAGLDLHDALPREAWQRLRTGRATWTRMAGLGLGRSG